MPFSQPFNDVYRIIKSTIEEPWDEFRLTCTRLDEVQTSGWIDKDLIGALERADICLADVTGNNANVMWEAGYAMALRQPLLIITQSLSELPFDLQTYRAIEYSPTDTARFADTLRRRIRAAVPQAHVPVPPFGEDALLEYLERAVVLSEQRGLIERFKTEGSMLVRLFLNHPREDYKTALRLARAFSVVRLDSGSRMAAASEAIRGAKTNVRAISDLESDRWSEQRAYCLLNQETARRLSDPIHRIVIFPDSGNITDEQKRTIRDEMAAGIEFCFAPRRVIDEFYDERKRPSVRNLLIVDREKMTRSVPSPDHRGEFVTARSDILREFEDFEMLWMSLLPDRERMSQFLIGI